MTELNKAFAAGYVARNPKEANSQGQPMWYREFTKQNGKEGAVINFTLGCNKGNGDTAWIKCVMFGKQATYFYNNIKQGDRVTIIDGHLDSNVYTDSNGKKHSEMVVVVEDKLYQRKANKSTASSNNSNTTNNVANSNSAADAQPNQGYNNSQNRQTDPFAKPQTNQTQGQTPFDNDGFPY